MAFIVKSDGKTHGTYNSCYESIRVADKLRARGHKVERIATGQDQTSPIDYQREVVNEGEKQLIQNWLKRVKNLDLHQAKNGYVKKGDRQ